RALRRHRGDRLGARGGRLLSPRRAGQAHGRDGRAPALLPGAGRPHGAVGEDGVRRGEGALRQGLMPTQVIMPALELAQETGKVLRWIKAPGDMVRKGDALVEIETDKVTVEIESPAAGVLRDVTAQEGDVIPVGQTIAVVVGTDETGATAP